MFGIYENNKNGYDTRKYVVSGAAFAVGLFTFMLYLKAITFDFVNWDDNFYVVRNSLLKKDWWEFTQTVFTRFYMDNWHPLTMLSYKFDYAIWGLDPMGYHLTNIMLHSLATMLVLICGYKVLGIVFSGAENDGRRLVGAVFCAVLFGVHPQHVESVAWISERKDQLSAIFFVLSVIFYLEHKGAQGNRAAWFYALSLSAFTLALMSKAMAVTLPVVLLILDFYPLRTIDTFKSLVRETVRKAPFLALSAIMSVITVLAQSTAIVPLEYKTGETRIANAIQSWVFYLKKLFYPEPLLPFYQQTAEFKYFSSETVVSFLVLLAVTAACVLWMKKRPYIGAAWAYYVLTLLPVIGLVQVGGQIAADRYMYIPSIGLFLLAGGVLGVLLGGGRKMIVKISAVVGAVFITVLLSVQASAQIEVWRDDGAMWMHQYKFAVAADMKQLALIKIGGYFYLRGQYEAAIAAYDAGLSPTALIPGDYMLRGDAYVAKGDFEKAAVDYKTMLALDRGVHFDAFFKLGKLYTASGMLKKADYYRSLGEKIRKGEKLAFEDIEKAAYPVKVARSSK
ncbi:MAG: tetratricopeptide repeat protein [Deltaproteobacteria bacterium]|nr:tetratricopeptide repeat protein [Deltaproteobacteria bacterium]